MPIQTLAELFLETIKFDKPDCLLHKVEGRFRPISTGELVRDVHRLAQALREAGVEPGDRVALMAENGPHWPTVDFAVLCIGAVLVPVYPTLPPDQAAYIVNDCGARLVFAQGRDRFEGLEGEQERLPKLERLVLIPEPGEVVAEGEATLEELIVSGEGADPADFEARARKVHEDDLATFIYTSGTTGNPKGVMLTHKNIVTNAIASQDVLDVGGDFTGLSFLPLSHSFERTVDYVYFLRGCTIAYAESVAAVGQNLQEVRPHFFVSVPRVYEKVLAKVQENVATSSPLKQRIFQWAVEVGRAAVPYRLQGQSPPGLLGLKVALADKLVFGKIRDRLGGRFQFAFSGGAPLSREVAEFFWGAGVPIYEGYGLTETSPVLTANKPGNAKLGTVGQPIADVTLKIAEDGEILAQGPNIMRGYWGMEEATREAIDPEGWFHTGDIGEIDDDGFLRITDRKKELIVNAYGKNIAPAPIENELKASRFIGQAMVIGDRHKFLSALLVPDFEALVPWAKSQGLATEDQAALVTDEAVRELLQGEVDATNGRNAKYERIVRWTALPEEWTVETEELTPTLKIKRRVITKNYAAAIEAMYAEAG